MHSQLVSSRRRYYEAETAEEAAGRVADFDENPIAVFPFDALAYRHDGDQGTAWLEPGGGVA